MANYTGYLTASSADDFALLLHWFAAAVPLCSQFDLAIAMEIYLVFFRQFYPEQLVEASYGDTTEVSYHGCPTYCR